MSTTLIYTARAIPSYFSATASMVGEIMRHGVHHTAQKSTNTGLSDCSTSASKVPSVVSVTCSLIDFPPRHLASYHYKARHIPRPRATRNYLEPSRCPASSPKVRVAYKNNSLPVFFHP